MAKPSTPRKRRSAPKRAPAGASQNGAASADGWTGFLLASCELWFEASLVIPLRLARLATGGEAAVREARLMIDEKVEAHGVVLGAIGSGRFGSAPGEIANGVMRYYLQCVRANRRRLMGGD